MFSDKIVAIEKRLEDLGYKFFNKNSIDVKYVYYHNPKESIDVKFDYISDEWELLSLGKSKVKEDKENLYSIAKVLGSRSLKTDDLHSKLVLSHKDLPKILNE